MKNIRTIFSKKKVCDNHSGFTLLEVLIAISILTVGLLGVAQMQIMGITGNYFILMIQSLETMLILLPSPL
jgi:prepilin-type N-terminal cleavage/methylation domain-containing protein